MNSKITCPKLHRSMLSLKELYARYIQHMVYFLPGKGCIACFYPTLDLKACNGFYVLFWTSKLFKFANIGILLTNDCKSNKVSRFFVNFINLTFDWVFKTDLNKSLQRTSLLTVKNKFLKINKSVNTRFGKLNFFSKLTN